MPEDMALQAIRELQDFTGILQKQHSKAFYVTMTITSLDRKIHQTITVQIDSGSTHSLIDCQFANKLGLHVVPLALPLEVKGCNKTTVNHIDGRVEAHLSINGHQKWMTLWVMNLIEDASILLGFNWLHNHNPSIDWEKETCMVNQCPFTCSSCHDLQEEDKLFCFNFHAYLKEIEGG